MLRHGVVRGLNGEKQKTGINSCVEGEAGVSLINAPDSPSEKYRGREGERAGGRTGQLKPARILLENGPRRPTSVTSARISKIPAYS